MAFNGDDRVVVPGAGVISLVLKYLFHHPFALSAKVHYRGGVSVGLNGRDGGHARTWPASGRVP